MKRKRLVIERTFDAPVETVWDAFTTPEILATWWSPAGMTNSFISAEVRTGGEFRYCFRSSDGKEFWGNGIYVTIRPPTFLSYIDNFTDENGKPVPPSHYGIPGDELTQSLVEITLTRDGARTHLTISAENPFDDTMTEPMTQGWNSMFDKLRDKLQKSF